MGTLCYVQPRNSPGPFGYLIAAFLTKAVCHLNGGSLFALQCAPAANQNSRSSLAASKILSRGFDALGTFAVFLFGVVS